MKEKINPFVLARYEHGYKSATSFTKDVGIPTSTYFNWENGRISFVNTRSALYFQKVCKAFGWSPSTGTEHISNIYRWTNNREITVVTPNWNDYKHIPRHLDSEVSSDSTYEGTSNEFDNKLRRWRHDHGFTIEQTADMLRIQATEYSDIEAGIIRPSLATLNELINITELHFQDINEIYLTYQESLRQQKHEVEWMVRTPEVPTTEEPIDDGYTHSPTPTDEYMKNVTISSDLVMKILDIVYGKVSLEEYRELEHLLGK